MNNSHVEANDMPDPTASWLTPFENTFLRLSKNAVIRQVIGPIDAPNHKRGQPLVGLSWQDFVADFAANDAKAGLLALWEAAAEGKVAPEHCPATVPFKAGVTAQLRTLRHEPEIGYAVRLASSLQCSLDTVIGAHTLNASNNLLQLSQSISRGVYGPLTDAQVKSVRSIVTLAETLDQFFNDLRVEITAPSTQAPMPYALDEILTFEIQEFSTVRRISTHKLGLTADLPGEKRVYCYSDVRAVFKRILKTLLENLSARTQISVSTAATDNKDIVRATISYHTTKPELLTTETLHPIPLIAAERFQTTSSLQQLLTRAQSYLSPVNGQVWAEPVTDDSDYTMCINIELPRWRD